MNTKNSEMTTDEVISKIAARLRSIRYFFVVLSILIGGTGYIDYVQYGAKGNGFLTGGISAFGFGFGVSIFLFFLAYMFKKKHEWTYGIVRYIVYANRLAFGWRFSKQIDSAKVRSVFGVGSNDPNDTGLS